MLRPPDATIVIKRATGSEERHPAHTTDSPGTLVVMAEPLSLGPGDSIWLDLGATPPEPATDEPLTPAPAAATTKKRSKTKES